MRISHVQYLESRAASALSIGVHGKGRLVSKRDSETTCSAHQKSIIGKIMFRLSLPVLRCPTRACHAFAVSNLTSLGYKQPSSRAVHRSSSKPEIFRSHQTFGETPLDSSAACYKISEGEKLI